MTNGSYFHHVSVPAIVTLDAKIEEPVSSDWPGGRQKSASIYFS